MNPSTRALVLDGSPSPAGDSMRLAWAMLDVFGGEADIIRLYDAPIRPCRDCGGCAVGSVCALDDDLAPFPERLAKADYLLIVSPVHFACLSAPLAAFFSRLQPFWQARRRGRDLLVRRPGQSALAVAGGSNYPDMFAPARAAAAAVSQSLGIHFAGLATAAGTDQLTVAQNPAALAAAARLAADMVARRAKQLEETRTAAYDGVQGRDGFSR